MALYMTRAKLSNEAFKGYVSNPQDREAAIKTLMSAVGVTNTQNVFQRRYGRNSHNRRGNC